MKLFAEPQLVEEQQIKLGCNIHAHTQEVINFSEQMYICRFVNKVNSKARLKKSRQQSIATGSHTFFNGLDVGL